MTWPSHGSNPKYLFDAMGVEVPDTYLDFSANINPLGPPSILKENWLKLYDKMVEYPDPLASNLKRMLGKEIGVPEDFLLIGNGGAELITLVTRLLSGKKALIVEPTFSEYEKACSINGCDVEYYKLKPPTWELDMEDMSSKLVDKDALFLCNPNNPTGVQYPKSYIYQLLEECEKHQCLLILDEAFYDFLVDYESPVPYISNFSNLIIIRSMTKMYAIPGIRLGYVIAQPEVINKLGKYQPHWSVNAVALLAGELLLRDSSFVEKTQNYTEKERIRIFDFLSTYHFQFSRSKVNFYLLKDPRIKDQYEIFQYLVKKGIVPRHTFNFPGLEGEWLRLAIKSTADNTQLMEVLKEWRKHHP